MSLSVQRRIKNMNDGAVKRDVWNVDGALDVRSGGGRSGEQQPTTDWPADDNIVLFNTRGQQINPLPTMMTAAEALEDSLGPRTSSLSRRVDLSQ